MVLEGQIRLRWYKLNREGTLVDLLLIIKDKLIGAVTVNSGLGHSSHKMEFKIPREARNLNS